MSKLLITAVIVALSASSASAFGGVSYFPNLTWPTADQTTSAPVTGEFVSISTSSQSK